MLARSDEAVSGSAVQVHMNLQGSDSESEKRFGAWFISFFVALLFLHVVLVAGKVRHKLQSVKLQLSSCVSLMSS